MSQTEREALEAGTVWWDGELFSGKPDWRKLLAVAARRRSRAEEQRFLDDEVEELCAMITDWETTHVYQRPAAAGLAVHQGQGLPRHDHPEGVRRPRASPRTRIRRW